MEENSSRMRWLVGVGLAAAAAFAIGIWRAEPAAPPTPADAGAPETPRASAKATQPAVTAEPRHRISERGRLTIESGDLPTFGPLTLALDLPDEARGSGPRSVQVGSEDGRAIHTTASIAPGEGSGVRIEIDSTWLRPGRYMIQLDTAEPTHFPLRRYVLEIR